MKLKLVGFAGILGVLAVYSVAFATQAGELDPNSAEALQKTQALLNDPQARQKAVNENAQSKAADAQVQTLTGGNAALNQSMYGLSAEVFEDIARLSGGDPVKMQAILAEAQTNPAAFKSKLSPKSQRAIEEMAVKVEAQKKPRVPASQ